jgi:serine/threonine protein kinase
MSTIDWRLCSHHPGVGFFCHAPPTSNSKPLQTPGILTSPSEFLKLKTLRDCPFSPYPRAPTGPFSHWKDLSQALDTGGVGGAGGKPHWKDTLPLDSSTPGGVATSGGGGKRPSSQLPMEGYVSLGGRVTPVETPTPPSPSLPPTPALSDPLACLLSTPDRAVGGPAPLRLSIPRHPGCTPERTIPVATIGRGKLLATAFSSPSPPAAMPPWSDSSKERRLSWGHTTHGAAALVTIGAGGLHHPMPRRPGGGEASGGGAGGCGGGGRGSSSSDHGSSGVGEGSEESVVRGVHPNTLVDTLLPRLHLPLVSPTSAVLQEGWAASWLSKVAKRQGPSTCPPSPCASPTPAPVLEALPLDGGEDTAPYTFEEEVRHFSLLPGVASPPQPVLGESGGGVAAAAAAAAAGGQGEGGEEGAVAASQNPSLLPFVHSFHPSYLSRALGGAAGDSASPHSDDEDDDDMDNEAGWYWRAPTSPLAPQSSRAGVKQKHQQQQQQLLLQQQQQQQARQSVQPRIDAPRGPYLLRPSTCVRHGVLTSEWEWCGGCALGEGGYASVQSVRACPTLPTPAHKPGSPPVLQAATRHAKAAVKSIRKRYLRTAEEVDSLEREVEVLRELSMAGGHPHIVGLLEAWEDGPEGEASPPPTSSLTSVAGGSIHLVLELVEGGDLGAFLRGRGIPRCSPKQVRGILDQLLSALAWMHGRGVLHGDLKPSNILIDSLGFEGGVAGPSPTFIHSVKLCDLGNSRRSRDARYYKVTGDVGLVPWSCVSGTMGYVAPEILQRRSYSTPVDIWGLGCILYELLAGFPPFHPYATCVDTPVQFPFPWGTPDIPEEAQHLVALMLQVEPSKRITAQAALTHPFLMRV